MIFWIILGAGDAARAVKKRLDDPAPTEAPVPSERGDDTKIESSDHRDTPASVGEAVERVRAHAHSVLYEGEDLFDSAEDEHGTLTALLADHARLAERVEEAERVQQDTDALLRETAANFHDQRRRADHAEQEAKAYRERAEKAEAQRDELSKASIDLIEGLAKQFPQARVLVDAMGGIESLRPTPTKEDE